ncbi:MAG: HAD-IA family hydrolase [Woeseia sp.]|nr:HAD-IA family hydrolase [Woeseia sp.]
MTDRKRQPNGPIQAVLFDLDGTLVDTAPDMVAALQKLQRERDAAPFDLELARANVSNGAAGLVRVAFPDVDDNIRADLHRAFLQIYQQQLCVRSRVFPGLDGLLAQLEQERRPWGVVTNKPQALTDALLVALQLTPRLACAISGDTLPQRKPHPAPMLLASRMLNVEPQHIVYVGDAARDIDAGRAAGMATVAAAWGYITEDDDPARWDADHIARDPGELTQLLAKELR